MTTPTDNPISLDLVVLRSTDLEASHTELVTTMKRKATEIIAGFDYTKGLGIIEGVARGERAIEEGRSVTHADAKNAWRDGSNNLGLPSPE